MPTFGATYFYGVLLNAVDLTTYYAPVGTLVRNVADGTFHYSNNGSAPGWTAIGGGGGSVQVFTEHNVSVVEGANSVAHGLGAVPDAYLVIPTNGEGAEIGYFPLPAVFGIDADATNVTFSALLGTGSTQGDSTAGYVSVFAMIT